MRQFCSNIRSNENAGLATSVQASNDEKTATVSTNQFHAPLHHFGGRAGRNRSAVIPARPFMVLTKPDQDEMEDVLRSFLDNL